MPSLLEAVPLVNHVQFGMFEQDVYIERTLGEPGMVYRVTPEEAADPLLQDAPLFATTEETEHDPSGQNDGPFPKGEALDLTLSEWLAGSGSMAYACVDGEGHITGRYQNLVPLGLYTVWNAKLTLEDGAIVAGQDLPAGPADGSENTFRADRSGNGQFSVSWDSCNPAGTFVPPDGSGEVWVLAIAYHSDDKSWGPSPGPFGETTHVHLFGMAWEGDTA